MQSISKFIEKLHKLNWQADPRGAIAFSNITVRIWRKNNRLCIVTLYPDLTHTIEFERLR